MVVTQRATRPCLRLAVLRVERLTPHMIRIVAGGPQIADFRPNGCTDAYVKVLLPVPGVSYPEPFDLQVIKATMPREHWPRMRSYTVRSYDEVKGELTLDFVVHGDEGLAGPWAMRARPGDELLISGPGGAYAPGDEADWHLLAGDESALPAISASLEAMSPAAVVRAFILVQDDTEELPLSTRAADSRIVWLHRSSGDDLEKAVRDLEFPEGLVQAFVHGEAGFVRELRKYLLGERGMRKDLLSISGYWRRGATDEEWRIQKAAEKNA
ncbi:NADPH-dependent ferric siderophore reductase, contains FAD-binding and SIP domains [Amycolatopsis xylanica]|uniref:NADPH-dependent ferric siderophore reductase, contains FAD-binding and SIP domains n=1 Tax=Amycolatopsis xylanica TaxID=589385 RepID=A0A1H3HCD3_9PSEU|nr:siderophore-interacting protein [Amycolatopsis xylanica]SDY13233.1 NADPH-dependent ferric siderophore reductase, contains FAD-binding and SIP domains [Amycolatopsis xylanica]